MCVNNLLLTVLLILLGIFITDRFLLYYNPSLCMTSPISWSFQVMSIVSFSIIGFTLLFFIVFMIYFFGSMRRLHKLEFGKHFRKYTSLTVSFVIFLAAEIVVVFMTYYLGTGAPKFENWFFRNLWQCIITTSVIEMCPYMLYLAINTMYRPHDCYKCFGKDPERKFSIYQYTKEERKAFETKKKGKGALKHEAQAAIDNYIRVESRKKR